MAYEFRHVFYASAAHMEPQRAAFHEVIAEINEACGIESGLLLVPVSLVPQMADKRAFQPAIESNIRQSSLYLQVFDGDWGPPERNFEADYAFALRCIDDPACSLQHAALLASAPLEEFKQSVRSLLATRLLDPHPSHPAEAVAR